MVRSFDDTCSAAGKPTAQRMMAGKLLFAKITTIFLFSNVVGIGSWRPDPNQQNVGQTEHGR
jgi:hypothetical protein